MTPNNDLFGGIRINLVGREPRGRVRPGPELEAVVEQLCTDLLALRNVESGGLVVKNVLRTCEFYDGRSSTCYRISSSTGTAAHRSARFTRPRRAPSREIRSRRGAVTIVQGVWS